MTIDLYFFRLSTPSRGVLTTLKHLGINVTIKETNPMTGDTRTPQFLKLNPGHTIPVLVDDEFVLYESRAIMQYLCNKYPDGATLYPEDAQERALVDKMLFFDGTSFYPPILSILLHKLSNSGPVPQDILDRLTDKMQLMETIMGDHKFVAGEQVSIADISLGASMPILQLLGSDFIPPKFQAWYDRVVAEVPHLKEINDQADYSPFIMKN